MNGFGISSQEAVLLVAGLLGGAVRAWVASDQTTFSRKSVGDIIVGAVSSVFLPLAAPYFVSSKILGEMTPFLWACMAFLAAYFCASTFTNLVTNRLVPYVMNRAGISNG